MHNRYIICVHVYNNNINPQSKQQYQNKQID